MIPSPSPLSQPFAVNVFRKAVTADHARFVSCVSASPAPVIVSGLSQVYDAAFSLLQAI